MYRTLPSAHGRPSLGPAATSRRSFLRAAAWGAAGTAFATRLQTNLAALAQRLRREGKSCILLWMQGGPSQFETFDPKPDHANGGETKAIPTAVSGIHIAEHLPEVAKECRHLCILRTVTGKEGSHPRASLLMHTGYLPTASVKFPALGAHVAYHLGEPDFDLPSFVYIGRGVPAGRAGFLGLEYDPFLVADPTKPPANTQLVTGRSQFSRRLKLMQQLESDFAAGGGKAIVDNHRKLYDQAARMVLSSRMKAFDLDQEPASRRDAYGSDQTAASFLLARRLIETGVPFVEVSVGNWDTHNDNFERTPQLCRQIDRPWAQLLRDLDERGLLERTLVIWTGEFGRTPRINPRGGRDHFPRAFSIVLAGCGVRGGQVIGKTDRSGNAIEDRPVPIPDFFRTIYHALGIDPDHEYTSNIGRPIAVADEGEIVKEVFQS